MKALYHKVYDLYRRWFGTYTLNDPRPIAKEAPYTYYLPTEREIRSVRVGDLVKLIFRSRPASLKTSAERMWVKVTEITADGMVGVLDNDPTDMPQLKPGATVHFKPFNIISCKFYNHPEDEEPSLRSYWERCMVDRCVLNDSVAVFYLYREEPDMTQEGDKYPDSGWRIRGDYRDLTDEQLDARKAEYIAIGKVLNVDDSWLPLIDAPVGSRFMRNFDTGEYEPYDSDQENTN